MVAAAGGVLGGWAELPYDSVILLPMALCFVIIGAMALSRPARALVRGDARWTAVRQLALVLICQPLFWSSIVGATRTFDRFGNEYRFRQHRAVYDRAVAAMLARRWSPGLHPFRMDDQSYQVSMTDAPRMVLSNAGYFSNWESVIYDRTGALGGIEVPIRDMSSASLRNAFGPFSIGYCERLSGSYFFCHFG